MTIRSIAEDNNCNPSEILYSALTRRNRAFIFASDLQIWYEIQQCQSSIKLKRIRKYFGKTKNQRVTIIEFLIWLHANNIFNREVLYSIIDSGVHLKFVVNSNRNILITEPAIFIFQLKKWFTKLEWIHQLIVILIFNCYVLNKRCTNQLRDI
jgi:hypothetical protein